MNKPLFATTLFSFFCFMAVAQVTAPDCNPAIPVCAANGPIIGFVDGMGDDDFNAAFNSGCLFKGGLAVATIENNSAWYRIRAGGTGQLGFNIEFLSPNEDWDFAVYGPDTGCGDLTNPIRCNYETGTTGFTGVGIDPATGDQSMEYDTWLDVIEGEEYIIFINNFNTNFSGNPVGFSIEFTGQLIDDNPDGSGLDCSIINEFLGLDRLVCEGEEVTLNATKFGATSYQWFLDTGLGPQPLAETGPELIITNSVSGTYSVIVDTPFQVFQDEVVVTFLGAPEIADVIVEDLSDSNSIRVVVNGPSDYEYRLNDRPHQDSPDFINIAPGLYQLTVNDKNGCGSTTREVLVAGYPKFFTPNGDGINDTWQIAGMDTFNAATVFIFDRYGKLLKQLLPGGTGWDGTFNGRPLPSSDYWFRFVYIDNTQGTPVQKEIKSHFSLKR